MCLSSLVDTGNVFCVFSFMEVVTMAGCIPITHFLCVKFNIKKILTNEKYMGDALLQKTYTTDFLTKTRVKNHGLMPQYYVENDHEAIIPKDIFLLVQEELARRRVVHTSANGIKRTYTGSHYFSQMVKCGECGEFYRRVHWNNRGLRSIVWRCVSRLEPIGVSCHSRTVNEETLHDVVVKAINQVMGDPESLKRQLKENIAAVVRKSDALSPETIDERLLELQKELLQKANQKDDYDAIADEILQLRDMKKQEAHSAASRDEQLRRITDLQKYIEEQPAELAEFDEKLFRRLIKEIAVHKKHFTVEFKSGVSVDIEG
ncbi:MAG: recombinase family protein [Firmicutes bacterium]|nr:recombinase family protein [Bacillota bacterium]